MMDGYRFVDCDIAEVAAPGGAAGGLIARQLVDCDIAEAAAAQRKPQQARRQDAVSTGE
jgi:hypothetical protein